MIGSELCSPLLGDLLDNSEDSLLLIVSRNQTMGCNAAPVIFDTAAVGDLHPIFLINLILIYGLYADCSQYKNTCIEFRQAYIP